MNMAANKRSVFYVSDRTGKTAESIGLSLLSQFDGVEFEHRSFPFVNSESEAQLVAGEIQQNAIITGKEPLVFSTLVDDDLQQFISSTNACVISLFDTFIKPLETSLEIQSSHTMGKSHEEYSDPEYKQRIDAIEFMLNNDDGIKTNQLQDADVILIGVSRCGKTPTCLYLAMNFSIKAANYPLTSDDLDDDLLPDFLSPYREKLIGLTIKAEQLSAIRERRRPKSKYASLAKCREETMQAEQILRNEKLFIVESTSMSIEEIAVSIVKEKKLLKKKRVSEINGRADIFQTGSYI